jgi:nitrile hydratase
MTTPQRPDAVHDGHVTHADLGGRRGYGPVVPEPEGELWHASWEPRALALTLAAGALGHWNIDTSRATREALPDYARLSYYEIWIHALDRLLRERGLLDRPAGASERVLHAADVAAVLARGSPTARDTAGPPRFAVGDRIRTWAGEVPHHTRLPRYARGKLGTIVHHHGAHVFADAHASGRGEMPQHLYTVAFEGRELWGGRGTPAEQAEAARLSVSIDAWEPYLQPEPVNP